jgi:hypothetical protein
LEIYLSEKEKASGAAVIICAGGRLEVLKTKTLPWFGSNSRIHGFDDERKE